MESLVWYKGLSLLSTLDSFRLPDGNAPEKWLWKLASGKTLCTIENIVLRHEERMDHNNEDDFENDFENDDDHDHETINDNIHNANDSARQHHVSVVGRYLCVLMFSFIHPLN
jgi:hypothetical protein